MINVGIIGSGFIVPHFIDAVKAVKGYHITAISGRNDKAITALKEKYDIDYCTVNNDDVYNDPKIDAIYVALPNGLHYETGKKALLADKHVIMEKPFTVTYDQAKELIDLAKKRKKIIFDAVTLLHKPNYAKVRELLPEVGEIKMVNLNFSQYSSRYDRLMKGIILPAFDYKMAGGALMDLGIYNINFVVGLFGSPKNVRYFPNMYKKVDTSGVLVMDYGKFKVNAISAKDCKAPNYFCIQGDKGYLRSEQACSVLSSFSLTDNSGKVKEFALNKHDELPHFHEYEVLKKIINSKDLKKAQELNKLTLKTIRVLEDSLHSGNIYFK
ncbi:MAG: Gfo/Idh/MocA family oxidoreductase [Erysipelotrichaceae bacterium]|nr:Gfo/Idh/MocA family oxidoreductase [Erysipelotrichaceae bacterium]